MSDKRSDKLIRELLGLYLRYGRKDFENAIRSIESGEALSLVAQLARSGNEMLAQAEATNNVTKSAETRKKTGKAKLSEFIQRLRQDERESARKIEDYLDTIASKDMLPSVSSLRAMMKYLGIPVPPKRDKVDLVLAIGEYLVELPEDRLDKLIERSTEVNPKKSSLQEWSDLIVKK